MSDVQTLAPPAGAVLAEGEQLSPEAAQERIDRAIGTPEFSQALFDPHHAGHRRAKRDLDELHKLAAGEGAGEPSSRNPSSAAGPAPDPADASGVPADPSDYEFGDLPQGAAPDTELQDQARQWFRDAGLTVSEGRQIAAIWNEWAGAPLPEDLGAAELHAESALKSFYGEAYSQKLATARAFLNRVPAAKALVEDAALYANPLFVRTLVEIAERGPRNWARQTFK